MIPTQIIQGYWQNGTDIGLGCALLGVTYLVLNHVIKPTIDPREPPILKPRLPLIGHIFGLLQHGVDYFSILGYDIHIHAYTNQSARTWTDS